MLKYVHSSAINFKDKKRTKKIVKKVFGNSITINLPKWSCL